MFRFFCIFFVLFFANVFGNRLELRDFPYTVELSIKKDGSFLEDISDFILESEIQTEMKKLAVFSQQNKPVSSIVMLTDRLNGDIKTIHKNLHTLGYYNAKVNYDMKANDDNSVIVFIKIDTKNKFNLDFSVKFTDQDEKFNEYYLDVLKKKYRRSKASMLEIRNVIDETLSSLKNVGFYNPIAQKKRVFINYEKGTAFLDLEIVCGENVDFGETRIQAFSGIDEQFIRNRLKWNRGEVFNQDKIYSSVAELKNTQIFSTVEIEPLLSDLNGKSLPICVKVEEDKKNMLDLSLVYQGGRNMNFEKKSQASKEVKSIIAKVSWTRFNAFGKGEKLIFNAEGTPLKSSEKRVDYAFETILTQPDVFMKDASMEYGAFYRQELTNVFFQKNRGCNFKYLFPVTDVLFADIGVTLEHNYVDSDPIFFRNKNLSHYYRTMTIPVSLTWDYTDNPLNPTSGFKFTLKGSLMRLFGAEVNSLKFGSLGFAYHNSLDKQKNNILAFNFCKKYIWGADIDKIPVNKRLYAGGINSVRGFANQMATEMVKESKVTMGGKSLFEFSTEFRRKINNDWGITAFFDGAKVYNNRSKYFKIDKKRWFFSVGAGVRYYMGIGPIRVDFAFPLHKRKGIDSKMQFMVGLGQAF